MASFLYRHKYRWCHPDRLLSASWLPLETRHQPEQRLPRYFPDGRTANGRRDAVHCNPGEHSLSRAGEVLHLHHRYREWRGLPAAGAHGSGKLRDDETHQRGRRRQLYAQRVREMSDVNRKMLTIPTSRWATLKILATTPNPNGPVRREMKKASCYIGNWLIIGLKLALRRYDWPKTGLNLTLVQFPPWHDSFGQIWTQQL